VHLRNEQLCNGSVRQLAIDCEHKPYDLAFMPRGMETASAKRNLFSSSLLKNLEMESFRILAGRCYGDAAELDVIFYPGVGCTLTRGG